VSPVFSLTHWIPFGENIENPDEEPVTKRSITRNPSQYHV
jgi:hypothetical protein